MEGTLLFIVLMLLILVPGVIFAVYRFRSYLRQEKERESRWDTMLTGDELGAVLKNAENAPAERMEESPDA
jgi:Tfp pilus assembly protein PilX